MKHKYTYIAVEDEPLQLANLVETLNMRLELEFLESFDNAEDAYRFLTSSQTEKPDLMFLDMQLPEVNGLQFLESIKMVEPKPKVIITTAFEEYAIESYEYDVSGYVVKPLNPIKLNKAIDKAIRDLSKNNTPNNTPPPPKSPEKPSIFIKVESRMVRLFHEEIIYLEGANVNVKVVTESDEYLTRNTLKKMVDMFPKKNFMRIHDSFIINFKYLKGYAANFSQADLKAGNGDMSVPIGKTYRDDFKNRMLGDSE